MEVKAWAPGKIILLGEHAVVHGATAVAAAIDLFTHVLMKTPLDSENFDGFLELQLKDLRLVFSWLIRRIKEAIPQLCISVSAPETSCTPETLKSIAVLVEEQNIPEAKIGLSAGVSTVISSKLAWIQQKYTSSSTPVHQILAA